ncbi:MAG TPA: FAD-dependent thymidylate synthase [Terriglobia bacterium]|nr:FAD-dependent thymidylate synthase [Terriglobia bacterium]
MNIATPYARLLNYEMLPFTVTDGIAALRKIEWCARISHRSEEAQTEDSWERFIRAVVLQHGDWSVVEHANATVDMLVDRGITHEIVRHRLFSFTQESTRFVNYEKKMPASFVVPELPDDAVRAGNGEQVELSASQWWRHAIKTAEDSYRGIISKGCPPQIARSVFPNALASRIIVTSNLRSWRHFLLMRTTREAHPQMRQVTIPLLEQFKASIPILFEDIEPMARQVENIAKGR